MPKFRKLPVVIDATQWVGHNRYDGMTPDIEMPIPSAPHHILRQRREIPFIGRQRWQIRTLEGWLNISPNDWIITGIKGERYPCKPDIFAATYEPVLSDDKRTELDGRAQSAVEQVQDY